MPVGKKNVSLYCSACGKTQFVDAHTEFKLIKLLIS